MKKLVSFTIVITLIFNVFVQSSFATAEIKYEKYKSREEAEDYWENFETNYKIYVNNLKHTVSEDEVRKIKEEFYDVIGGVLQKVEIEYYNINRNGNFKKISNIILNSNNEINNYLKEPSYYATNNANIGDVKVISDDVGLAEGFKPHNKREASLLPSLIGASIGLVAGAISPVAGVIGSIIGMAIPPAQQNNFKDPLVETKNNRIFYSRSVLVYTEDGWLDYASSAKLETELSTYFTAYDKSLHKYREKSRQYGTIKIEYGENYDKKSLISMALDAWENNRSKYVEYYQNGPEEINSSIIKHFEKCAKEWE